MTRVFALVTLVCLATAAPPQRPPAPPGADREAGWPSWLATQTAGFSGVALIGRDDVIDAEVASGLADATTGRPNTTTTRFNLGSINKTFTAVAIAQLIQQGRLALDDTLGRHLADYPNRDAAARITIRQLLTHRSGVAQFMRADFGDVTVAAMTTVVGETPLAFEPGTRQMYSNGGYVVLGRIVEVVSGQRYEDYVTDHIYRPAGMTASGFVRTVDRRDAIAWPVAADGTGRGGVAGTPPLPVAPRPGNPAGGGYSTAADLYRFARALRTGRLLDSKMTAFLLDGTFAEDPKWGFSLREQIVGSRRFIGNGGGAPGVNAEFRFEPSGPYTVVVLSNSSPPAATNLLTAVLTRIAEAGAPVATPRTQSGSASASGQSPRTRGLRADVEALHVEMMAAFRDQPASVARYYTNDARILGGGRRYSGTEQVRAYFGQVPAGATWTLEIVDVGGGPTEPWVLGRSTLARPGSTGMAVDYLAVLQRGEDGRLRYDVDMFTAGVR
jgi:CubicO group peptidase (beta-lactamase class C family)